MKKLAILAFLLFGCSNNDKIISYSPIPTPSNFHISQCFHCYQFRWDYEQVNYDVYFRIQYYFWINDSWVVLPADSSLTNVIIDENSPNYHLLNGDKIFRILATDGLRESISDTLHTQF